MIHRFAVGTRFFCTFKNGNFLNGLRQGCQEMFFRPGTEHVNIDTAHFFAFFIQIANRFFNGLSTGTDGDNNIFRIGCPRIIEEMVFTTGYFMNHLHVFFSCFGNLVIETVQRFFMLHINFRRFTESYGFGIIRIHRMLAKSFNCFHIEHGAQVFIINNFDFL